MAVTEQLGTVKTSCKTLLPRPSGLRDSTWPTEWYQPKHDFGGSIPVCEKERRREEISQSLLESQGVDSIADFGI